MKAPVYSKNERKTKKIKKGLAIFKKLWYYIQAVERLSKNELVLITAGVHPFPSRTRKLSPFVPKILGWRRPGKIGVRQHSRRFPLGDRLFALSASFKTLRREGSSMRLFHVSEEPGIQVFHPRPPPGRTWTLAWVWCGPLTGSACPTSSRPETAPG